MIKNKVARILYSYGATRTVLRGPARGKRFVVENGMGLTYGLGFADATPAFFSRWIRPGMTAYDLCANKGQMMLLFASLVGERGRVVSFEPAPTEFSSLSRNIEINDLGHRVHAVHAAVADQGGDIVFTYAPSRPTQGKLKSVDKTYVNHGADEFIVSSITLDDFCSEQESNPDFIKIDVEGGAASVLRGAQRMLSEASPIVFIELHGPEEQAGVRDHLLTLGYTAKTMGGQRIADPTSGWFSPLVCTKPS